MLGGRAKDLVGQFYGVASVFDGVVAHVLQDRWQTKLKNKSLNDTLELWLHLMAGKCIANNVNVNPLSYTSCDVRVKSQKLRADPCLGYCKNMAALYNITSGPALYVNVYFCDLKKY